MDFFSKFGFFAFEFLCALLWLKNLLLSFRFFNNFLVNIFDFEVFLFNISQ